MSYPTAEFDDGFLPNSGYDDVEPSESGDYVVHSCELSTNRTRHRFLKYGFIAALAIQGVVLLLGVAFFLFYIGYVLYKLGTDATSTPVDMQSATLIIIAILVAGIIQGVFLGFGVVGTLRKRPALLWLHFGYWTVGFLMSAFHLVYLVVILAHGPQAIHILMVLPVLVVEILPALIVTLLTFFNIKAMNTCRECY
ncbi:unnamed protein product, partial [Mesorhabditis spiculigera]